MPERCRGQRPKPRSLPTGSEGVRLAGIMKPVPECPTDTGIEFGCDCHGALIDVVLHLLAQAIWRCRRRIRCTS
jgi:hypothetical protein